MTDSPQQRYEISSDPARLDPARIHHWLSTDAYWALGRTREKQDLAIAGSLNFGAYDTISGEQVGYARVVTDHVTFAWLCDVYVDRSARGHGLGIRLAAAVRDHLARPASAGSRSPPTTPTGSTRRSASSRWGAPRSGCISGSTPSDPSDQAPP